MKFVSKSNFIKNNKSRVLYLNGVSCFLKAIIFICAVILLAASRSSAQLRGIVPVINRDRDAVAVKHVYEPNSDGSYVYRCAFLDYFKSLQNDQNL